MSTKRPPTKKARARDAGRGFDPSTSPNSRLTRNLLQNAESFFEESVSYVERGKEQDWVFAVVHVAIAIELTLKAVLHSEHWSLVFDDIDAASIAALISGHFKSVSFVEALRRVQEIADVKFDPKDVRYMQQLNDLRNQVLHFGFDLNVEQVKGLVARGLNIFTHLMTTRLRRGRRLAFEVSGRLLDFERYVSERMRRLAPRLKKLRRPPSYFRGCDKCGQDALVLNNGEPTCLYCGCHPTVNDLVQRTEADEGACPNCEEGRLGFILFNNEEGEVACVLCGFVAEGSARNRTCDYCGEQFWDASGEGMNMCQNCLGHYMEKD